MFCANQWVHKWFTLTNTLYAQCNKWRGLHCYDGAMFCRLCTKYHYEGIQKFNVHKFNLVKLNFLSINIKCYNIKSIQLLIHTINAYLLSTVLCIKTIFLQWIAISLQQLYIIPNCTKMNGFICVSIISNRHIAALHN